jgi:kumamolisin
VGRVSFSISGVALILVGCGGTSGSNSIIAPASDPTCTTPAIPLKSSNIDNLQELQRPGVIVPSTTVARTIDAGVNAHTNHLISQASATGRLIGPTGLTPQQLYVAYSIPSGLGQGAIAIVDAYHYPTSLADFNTFSIQFGLPPEQSVSATSSSNTVFQVVFASGTQPVVDSGWSQEMAIDTQWSHAMAPHAKIYLVEAKSSSVADLMAAVIIAKALPGVTQVSMSFGSPESACNFVHYDPNLVQAGVVFFAAAGDTPNELDFPALSKNAVSVGGTTLNFDSMGNRLFENSWSRTGGGASKFEPRPVFQNVVASTVQAYRGGCDISAVGDPLTGLSVYDSTPSGGFSGWLNFGGTSVSCPIVAGIANAANVPFASSQAFNAAVYGELGSPVFHDVTHGTSGTNAAGHGWDYLSGVGTPNGVSGL